MSSQANGTNGAAQPNGSASPSTIPKLEDLIATYGDSSNTTWIEQRFHVWRHQPTVAAQGYAVSNGVCIIWGNPLCQKSQYPEVASAFLEWCEKEGLKPICACANRELEQYLAKERGWQSAWCVQEDALDLTKANPEANKEVRKHIRGAERKGCSIIEEEDVPPEDVQREIDEVIKEWKANRKGTQVHVTDVQPWKDTEHRKYFYARDAEGKIVGFLFLSKIARGWTIKDCIQMPSAPKNLAEWLITEAIHSLARDDEHYFTFGPTPAPALEPVNNLKSSTVKFLAKTYGGIKKAFLGNKREFRRKFDVEGEPVFVCFPENGLGRSGIGALMKVLTD